MKKKFLAVLLAVSMLAGTGLAVPGNLTVQAEENETVERKAEENGAVDAVGDEEDDDDNEENEKYGYDYIVLNDGTVEIRHCYKKGITEVTIPSEIEGRKVTSIGESAFAYCKKIQKVEIPDTVTNIGASAFKGCECLTDLVIPNSVTSVGNSAFTFTAWLENRGNEKYDYI